MFQKEGNVDVQFFKFFFYKKINSIYLRYFYNFYLTFFFTMPFNIFIPYILFEYS